MNRQKHRLAWEHPLGVAAMLLLVGMTALTCVDVVARYWFNSPVDGAFELTRMMLAGLIFAALPMTTAAGEHVDVELFTLAVGKKARIVFHMAGQTIAALVLFVLGWRVWVHADKLAHDGTISNSLGLPFAPIGYFAAISCVLSGVIALIGLIHAFPSSARRTGGPRS